jgi:hypothetical protein
LSWNEYISNYHFVNVICPHFGAKNTHKEDGKGTHIECHLMLDKKGKKYIMTVLVILFVDILHLDSSILNLQVCKVEYMK